MALRVESPRAGAEQYRADRGPAAAVFSGCTTRRRRSPAAPSASQVRRIARGVALHSLRSLALAAACLAAAGCAREEARPRKNVLLLSIDTLRADHLGVFGYGRPTSPAIDAFARGAVVFDAAYTHASWTLPSFASLLTSTYSSTHRCINFSSVLDPSFTTLPEMLKACGYRTAGVASHVFLGKRHGLHQGIDEFDDQLVLEMLESHKAISSPAVTEKGIAWLERTAADPGGKPWFLWLHYFDPHEVYQRHDATADQFPGPAEMDLYDGEIAFTDSFVGRVLAALDRLKLADDTIVVLLSDHGEEFYDHGDLRHGLTLHREVVRIPLMIRAPGIASRRVEQVVRMVDVLPTLLELLALPKASIAQGTSLARAMNGERIEELPVYAELRLREDYFADAIQQGRWKLIIDHSGASRIRGLQSTLDENGLRVRPKAEKAFLLYEIAADPLEKFDVAAEHGDVVERLRGLLGAAQQRAADLAEHGGFSYTKDLELSGTDLDQLRELGYVGNKDG